MSGNALALKENTGVYSGPGDLSDGYWEETFIKGPGQPGNSLDAEAWDQSDKTQMPQWQFSGTLVSVATSTDPNYDYQTTYAGKFAVDDGIWGEAFGIEVKGFNFSTFDPKGPNLNFKFDLYGETDGYQIYVTAFFTGIGGDNCKFYEMSGQAGWGFDKLSMTIKSTGQPVPEPASLILLASGLAGFSRRKFFKDLFLLLHAPDDAMPDPWEAEYWETVKRHTAMFPEAGQVLAALNKKYAVALITNTQGQKTAGNHRISLFPELEQYFEVIIVAGEGGVPPKPAPEPFRRCLAQLQILPAEAVYVGDDYRIDVCGSKDAGLHPIWLQHHSVRRNWPKIKASVPVITSLEQLLDLQDLRRD